MSEKAKAAISAVLAKIQLDPRVAYYFNQMTDCYQKLTAAHCELNWLDDVEFKKSFEASLTYDEPPDRELVKVLTEALTMVRDADNDCKPNDLSTMSLDVRAKINAALTAVGAA